MHDGPSAGIDMEIPFSRVKGSGFRVLLGAMLKLCYSFLGSPVRILADAPPFGHAQRRVDSAVLCRASSR